MNSCANARRSFMAWVMYEAAPVTLLSVMLIVNIRVVTCTRKASATRVGSAVASRFDSVLLNGG